MQINPTVMPSTDKSVVAYLTSLIWDGTRRLDRWLIDCAGAEDTPYVRTVSRGALVAAVRRARSPGCRFDQMLVLEGSQGSGKLSALRVLAGKDWFTDDLPLHGDARRFREATEGKWIVEVVLDDMNRSSAAALKTCLSCQYDEARMPYARESTRLARQLVIIGTTNETTGYFRDETGNRRFWPVHVQRFDLKKLQADRDQLWAEAAEAEACGESIDLGRLCLGTAVDPDMKHAPRLTVTLKKDCQIDDIEAVMNAVRMIRGITTVEQT